MINAIRRALFCTVFLALASGVGPITAEQPTPQVQLLWRTSIPATAVDRSELNQTLEDGTPHNQLGGFSAIEYSGRDDLYWVLPDRGPKDGAVSYRCRIHSLRITPNSIAGANARVEQTIFLNDSQGRGLNGALTSVPGDWNQRGEALDPEAVRVSATGGLLISDEYGPFIDLFDYSGRLLSSWHLPEELRLPRGAEAVRATQGAVPNRGLEGLAICPGGKKMVAAFQGSLLQDSEPRDGKRNGRYCRLLVLDGLIANQPIQQQLAYPLESRENGISEILAIDENRFLVLERDSLPANQSLCKSIFLIDTRTATSLTSGQQLPVEANLPEGMKTVEKSLFINLLDAHYGLKELSGLEKVEGITWGPRLNDGRRQLIVCSDNDFDPMRDTQLFAFAVRLE